MEVMGALQRGHVVLLERGWITQLQMHSRSKMWVQGVMVAGSEMGSMQMAQISGGGEVGGESESMGVGVVLRLDASGSEVEEMVSHEVSEETLGCDRSSSAESAWSSDSVDAWGMLRRVGVQRLVGCCG